MKRNAETIRSTFFVVNLKENYQSSERKITSILTSKTRTLAGFARFFMTTIDYI